MTQASKAKWQCQALGPADQEEFPNFPSELSSLNISVTLHWNNSSWVSRGQGKVLGQRSLEIMWMVAGELGPGGHCPEWGAEDG